MYKKKARIIAFYLPQYHPTPENDKFWGKGFTEWTNVAKARPLFRRHYQPRIPADLGFYDLRLPQIRDAQAELARDAGIEGFMYWHYWFGNGVMTLQDVFEDVLKSKKPDFPFCLGWANHSWSNKTWTKGKSFQQDAMIFEMKYPGDEDIINHFNYCLPAFKDERYIKVDGKPLFYIWAPHDMPNLKHFIEMWKTLALKAGLPGIHFVGQKGLETNKDFYFDAGFDAICANHLQYAEDHAFNYVFLKKLKSLIVRLTGGRFGVLRKYNFKKIYKNLILTEDFDPNVYPTILSGYDRTARAGKKATIYYNYTPEIFKRHVEQALQAVENKNDEHRIVFLKSWNEWAEGNYMEPDLKYGSAFLDALKESVLF